MRVLTVGNMYPPLHEGGYELVWKDAVEHLTDRGDDVVVLTTTHRAGERKGPEPGIYRELYWYWQDHAWPRLGPVERLRLERHNAAVLNRRLSAMTPDVIAWWSMGGMSLSLIERARRDTVPTVAVVCDDWMLYAPEADGWTRIGLNHRAVASLAGGVTGLPMRADLATIGPCLFPSETTRDRALKRWPLRDTVVCRQGVDRAAFAPALPRAWRWRLLYAGRIDERKGIDLAVAALSELPNATLTIAGHGGDAYRSKLDSLVSSLGLADRVTFTHAAHANMRELYAAADAVVFPVRWHEPWGLVPLEAMSVGRPVIATGMGGSGEYLRGGVNCLLFDPKEGPSSLAERVRTLADDSGLRDRLREQGLATAGRFGKEDFSRAFAKLVDRAARSGGSAYG